MGKKIKKKANFQETMSALQEKQHSAVEDEKLDDVEEDQSFEIATEDDLIYFVDHYRKKWGDDFDADIEKSFTVQEIKDLIVYLLQSVDTIEKQQLEALQARHGIPMQVEGSVTIPIPPKEIKEEIKGE